MWLKKTLYKFVLYPQIFTIIVCYKGNWSELGVAVLFDILFQTTARLLVRTSNSTYPIQKDYNVNEELTIKKNVFLTKNDGAYGRWIYVRWFLPSKQSWSVLNHEN